MRRLLRNLALITVAFAAGASAQTSPLIETARAAGQVGERYDGYIGFVVPPSPSLRDEVGEVNIKRRALYSNLAARRGVAPADVGVTAGCELLARVKIGESYLLQDGIWRRRAASDSPPVPAYCKP